MHTYIQLQGTMLTSTSLINPNSAIQ